MRTRWPHKLPITRWAATQLAVLRSEAERSKNLTQAWSEKPLCDSAATDLLRSVGSKLQGISQMPKPGDDRELELQVVRLCLYFESKDRFTAHEQYWRVPKLLLSATIPWLAGRRIRSAPARPIPARGSPEPVSLQQFGLFLHRYALALSSPEPNKRYLLSEENELVQLADDRVQDSCAERPIDLAETFFRLHTLIENASTPPSQINQLNIGITVGVAALIAVVGGSWASLGLRQDLHGVRSVLVPMLCALIAAAACCAASLETLTSRLNVYGVAQVKTLNKCTTALLAFATLLFGIGLGTGNTARLPIYIGLLAYAATVVTTISSEHMVNTGEARLKELT